MNVLDRETVVSKKSGKTKTLGELIKNFLERGRIEINDFSPKMINRTEYGDGDHILHLDLQSIPQMSNSPSVQIRGKIPVHVNYAGKMSLGLLSGAGRGSSWEQEEEQEGENNQESDTSLASFSY